MEQKYPTEKNSSLIIPFNRNLNFDINKFHLIGWILSHFQLQMSLFLFIIVFINFFYLFRLKNHSRESVKNGKGTDRQRRSTMTIFILLSWCIWSKQRRFVAHTSSKWINNSSCCFPPSHFFGHRESSSLWLFIGPQNKKVISAPPRLSDSLISSNEIVFDVRFRAEINI